MDWTATAVGENPVVLRRVALAQDAGDELVAQVNLKQGHHALRGVADVQSERIGELSLDLVICALLVELDLAAEEVVRVEVPQDDVAISDGRHRDATLRPGDPDPVASAVRTDLDPVGPGRETHQRAGAGAHRVDLDERQFEHESRDVRLGLDRELAARDERQIEARAADVGTDNIVESEHVGEVLGADDAADRARYQRPRELLSVSRDGAAVRCHDPQFQVGAELLDAVLDAMELAA